MANNIERLNYYEREHLRSFDFVAEQNYHLEMRRRLNLALHLWGIVEGLDIRKGSLVPGAPDQFFITEGMAIDAYGREILLFAPYALSEDDLFSNRIGQKGRYSLWIAYQRNQATPPSPGYGICDMQGQYTRWRESYKVLIREETYANGTEPRVFDTLSDDPESASWLVRLGTIDTDLVSNELTIVDARPEQRTYIGLRAQRVVAPVTSLIPPSTDAALPIAVENDVLEKKNLIVGPDFVIDTTKVKPPPDPVKFPDPTKFPGPSGNIKTTNLFLLDNLYAAVGAEWLGLKEYVKTVIPDIQVGTQTLVVAPGNDPSTGSSMIHVKSVLPVVNTLPPNGPKLIASFSAINWLNKTDYAIWDANISAGNDVQLEIGVGAAVLTPNTNNEFDFPVAWTIGPRSTAGTPPPPSEMLNITKLLISWVAVFHP